MKELKYVYDVEINGVEVLATEEVPDKEVIQYIHRYKEKKPGLYKLYLDIDGDYVDVCYQYKEEHVPFERIRRITGYLVGSMDKWNDAKRAEEADRVKNEV